MATGMNDGGGGARKPPRDRADLEPSRPRHATTSQRFDDRRTRPASRKSERSTGHATGGPGSQRPTRTDRRTRPASPSRKPNRPSARHGAAQRGSFRPPSPVSSPSTPSHIPYRAFSLLASKPIFLLIAAILIIVLGVVGMRAILGVGGAQPEVPSETQSTESSIPVEDATAQPVE